MNRSNLRIELREIQLSGHIGVSCEERSVPQPLEVSLVLLLDRGDEREDELSTTVDYSQVLEKLQDRIEASQYLLLETLANRVAEDMLTFSKVKSAEVTIRKLRPPVPQSMRDAGVVLLCERVE